jgi:hypothetical protein
LPTDRRPTGPKGKRWFNAANKCSGWVLSSHRIDAMNPPIDEAKMAAGVEQATVRLFFGV